MFRERKSLFVYLTALSLCLMLFAGYAVASSKEGRIIHGVPLINQLPEFPTGCEVTSMTMLAQYHGLEVDKKRMAAFLPKGQKPYLKNGVSYGADPRVVFVGTPEDKSSFGVYHQPVLQVLDTLFPYRAKNLTGSSLETLFGYIRQDMPVLVWTTFPTVNGGLINTKEVREWKLDDGSTFEWIRNEHVMLMVGVTANHRFVILNDPYTGKQQKYPYEMFKVSYEMLGRQAVTITHGSRHDSAGK